MYADNVWWINDSLSRQSRNFEASWPTTVHLFETICRMTRGAFISATNILKRYWERMQRQSASTLLDAYRMRLTRSRRFGTFWYWTPQSRFTYVLGEVSMEMTRDNRSLSLSGVCTPTNALLQGRTSCELGRLDPLKIGWDMFWPGLKCHILSFRTVVG